jgi:hypothetical protein
VTSGLEPADCLVVLFGREVTVLEVSADSHVCLLIVVGDGSRSKPDLVEARTLRNSSVTGARVSCALC